SSSSSSIPSHHPNGLNGFSNNGINGSGVGIGAGVSGVATFASAGYASHPAGMMNGGIGTIMPATLGSSSSSSYPSSNSQPSASQPFSINRLHTPQHSHAYTHGPRPSHTDSLHHHTSSL